MKNFLQFIHSTIFLVFLSKNILGSEVTALTESDFPPVIARHQSIKGVSAFEYLKKLLSPEYAKQIAYVGTYKLYEDVENSDYIVRMIEDFKINKTPDCDYKIFSESRLTEAENRLTAQSPSKGRQALMKAAGSFFVSNLASFDNLHFKIVLTENCFSIGTTNHDGHLKPKYPYHSRDFTLFITDSAIINEGISVFHNIFSKKTPTIPFYKVNDLKKGETRLSWGPWHHLDHIIGLIEQAAFTIDIYQQDLQSSFIVEKLKEKLNQKVKVRILMSGYPFGKVNGNKNLNNLRQLEDAGAEILLTGKKSKGKFFDRPLHIHAKVLICDAGTDKEAMYLGSANFYPDVLDPSKKNLNVGIITKDVKFIQPVMTFFNGDWEDHTNFQEASLDYWEQKINFDKARQK